MFKSYTIVDNLQYCLVGCWKMCFLESVLAQSSMYFKQVLIFSLLCCHVLGAPKRKKPQERFWAPQQMDMPAKARAGKKIGYKLTRLYKKKQIVSWSWRCIPASSNCWRSRIRFWQPNPGEKEAQAWRRLWPWKRQKCSKKLGLAEKKQYLAKALLGQSSHEKSKTKSEWFQPAMASIPSTPWMVEWLQPGAPAKLWHSKPKFHLFAHILDLASDGNHPKDSWNYRDETMAGTVPFLAFRRGGKFQPGKATEKILLRWMADHFDWISDSLHKAHNLQGFDNKACKGSQSSRIWQQSLQRLTVFKGLTKACKGSDLALISQRKNVLAAISGGFWILYHIYFYIYIYTNIYIYMYIYVYT